LTTFSLSVVCDCERSPTTLSRPGRVGLIGSFFLDVPPRPGRRPPRRITHRSGSRAQTYAAQFDLDDSVPVRDGCCRKDDVAGAPAVVPPTVVLGRPGRGCRGHRTRALIPKADCAGAFNTTVVPRDGPLPLVGTVADPCTRSPRVAADQIRAGREGATHGRVS